MKKVLLISDAENFGGAEKYIESLIKLMDDKVKYVIAGDKQLSRISNEKVKIYEEVISNKKPIKTIISFIKILLLEKPDIVHLNMNHPASCLWIQLFSLFLTKINFVGTLHIVANINYPSIVKCLLKITYRKIKIICVSHSGAKELAENYGIKSKYTVIPNWVDMDWFRIPSKAEKKNLRNKFIINDDTNVAVFIGRLEDQKNVFNVIEVANLLKDKNWRFYIVGDGSLSNQLQNRVRELNLDNVIFNPFTKNPRTYYWLADVFLLLSKYECTPLSLLEAMSCGVSPVVTDVGDMKRMVGSYDFVWDSVQVTDILIKLKNSMNKNKDYWRNKVLKNYSPQNSKKLLLNVYGIM